MVDISLRGYEDISELIRHSYYLEKSGLCRSFEPVSATGKVVAIIRSSNVTENWKCTGRARYGNTDIFWGNLRLVGAVLLVKLVRTRVQFIAIHKSEIADFSDLWP